jgi:signal transduction histidine kinase/CheY-like chemotaxis protein
VPQIPDIGLSSSRIPTGVDLNEPHTGPSSSLRSWRWRRLPLTAQLGLIGMVVTLAWFLTARLAADRVADDARIRNDRLDELHQAEVAAVRLYTSATVMSASQRGFVVFGDESYGVRYETARRSFATDVGIVREMMQNSLNVRLELDRLVGMLDRWDGEVVTPNFALRRERGFAAFAPGTVGAARLERGAILLDSVRVLHAAIVRDVRSELIALEQEIETAVAVNELETFLIRAAAVAVFLLLLILLMRLLARALRQVVVAAEALDAGRYDDARLPNAHRAPNLEMARLAPTFDRLALSIATRERQLQDDIEKLKELERLKADFVSTVSHELRTPLTSMRGALGLLLGGAGGDLSPKGRDLLRIALTNTDRLIRLINDILDIEKMDAGQVSIRRDRLRLRPLLESTIAGLEGLGRDADVRLVLEDIVDVEVIGDSDRLIQVFTNLISNAVKFSPKGGAVEVSARLDDIGVKIGVRDHGPGIPAEFASRIFGRFQQAGGAASRQSGGTGLGLSIAKGITELHGGRIGFENAEGGGTSFWLVLPVAPAISGIEDARPGVLIVEDDDSMRAILSALLEPFSNPVAVGDAETAMRALSRQQVKVVVVDHGLPGVDGLALARRLRADPRYRTLAILLYSASEFGPDDLRDSGIRISDAFVKTRDPESALINRIKRELQGTQEPRG